MRSVRRRFHAHRRNLPYSQRPAVDIRIWYQDLYDRLEQAELIGPLEIWDVTRSVISGGHFASRFS